MKFLPAIILALTAVSSTATTTPLDLSKDLVDASENDGATKLIEDIFADQDSPYREAIRTLTVLEHGQIVTSYVRDDVDPNDPFDLQSVVKCVITLLFGILVEQGLLSLDETMGSIFTDESVWTNLVNQTEEEVAYKKSVTINELLTMTSGLVCPDTFCLLSCPDGGQDLADALSCPVIDPGVRGSYAYLTVSNILSYVLKEKTGSTPREFLAANVLSPLGIDDASIEWSKNNDGVEIAFGGRNDGALKLTTPQMAKIGQLHLQNGFSAPGKPVVSADFIEAVLSEQVARDESHDGGYTNWAILNGTSLGVPEAGRFVCGSGAFGQYICICSPELDRVFVQQTDIHHGGSPARWLQTFDQTRSAALACNKSLTFDTSPPPAATPSPKDNPTTSSALLPSYLKKSVGVVIFFGSLFSWLL